MAYNEELADRIRERLAHLENIEEKKMMGGLAFLVNDKMCVGVIKDDLMCRIDPSLHEMAVERHGCRTMDFTHRPMSGYIFVDETGMKSKSDFDYWIELALEFNKRAKSSKQPKKNAGKK
jgi:TfoX/Sxy family transcriptional regulator of competence genes